MYRRKSGQVVVTCDKVSLQHFVVALLQLGERLLVRDVADDCVVVVMWSNLTDHTVNLMAKCGPCE